jgi:hypothetical protein
MYASGLGVVPLELDDAEHCAYTSAANRVRSLLVERHALARSSPRAAACARLREQVTAQPPA